jgi:hypothetical protein
MLPQYKKISCFRFCFFQKMLFTRSKLEDAKKRTVVQAAKANTKVLVTFSFDMAGFNKKNIIVDRSF